MKFYVRASVHLVLLVVALNYFGLPSLRRYLDKKVVVTSSEEDKDDRVAPAVTVCAQNPQTGHGFPKAEKKYADSESDSDSDYSGYVKDVCGGNEKEDIAKCIEKNTFSLESTIEAAEVYDKLWVPDFTSPQIGMCHTLKGLDIFEKPFISFAENNTYVVFLHDPNLFLINYNPLVPITRKELQD